MHVTANRDWRLQHTHLRGALGLRRCSFDFSGVILFYARRGPSEMLQAFAFLLD